MKAPAILTLGVLACVASIPSFTLGQTAGASKGKKVIRDAATHETLATALRTAQQTNSVTVVAPEKVDEKAVKKTTSDLITDSDIICFNGMATLVPKRAVLHVPERMQNRLALKAGAKLTTWDKFYAANRAWISTLEVDFEQATGEKVFSEKQAATLANTSRLVVATYQKGPISVLPPKEPDPAAEATETATR